MTEEVRPRIHRLRLTVYCHPNAGASVWLTGYYTADLGYRVPLMVRTEMVSEPNRYDLHHLLGQATGALSGLTDRA